jgi:Inositol hexakisphosphate
VIRNLSSLYRGSGPPKVQKTESGVNGPSVPSTNDHSAKDRADLALENLKNEPKSQSKTPKKSLASIMGAVALLGLSGLGIFQGITASKAQPSVPETELVTERTTQSRDQSPELLTQMEVTPEMLVAGRQGQLLGQGKILKFDQYPGLHHEHLSESIPGAPNFRQVEGTNVYGVAQPTADGIREVLERAGAKEKTVVWTNMREEPVVYINGRSFSLRDEAHPYENSDNFKGATEESVMRSEEQLKADVIAEAKANGGMILLHGEDKDGVTSEWIEVSEGSVKTTSEVFQQIRGEGFKVDFARVPVTDEKTPEYGDLQAVVDRVRQAEDGAPLIFNCHAGRGRTTTAMVAAQLIQKAQGMGEQQAFQKMDSVRRDIREQGNYEQGNYRLILRLVKSLDNGLIAKTETDQVLDQTEDLQNLRVDINKYREKALSADDPSSAKKAEARGLDYLHRYHTLITFNQYVKDQAPKGFELTFEQWLEARPEVTEMLQTFELAMTTPMGDSGSQSSAHYA